jgi:hypothetical protein
MRMKEPNDKVANITLIPYSEPSDKDESTEEV